RLELEIGAPRRRNLVADRPRRAAVNRGAVGAYRAAVRQDLDAGQEVPRRLLVVARRLDSRAHENVGAFHAVDTDAAVRPSVDGQGAGRGQGHLADLTGARPASPPAARPGVAPRSKTP